MTCPKSQYPSGIHSWIKSTNGRASSWWKCLMCGKRRKAQRTQWRRIKRTGLI